MTDVLSSNASTTSSSPTASDYILTTTQNYVSRSAQIQKPSVVRIKGKSIIAASVTIHGDYGSPIQIGRYCHIHEGVLIAPTVVPVSSDALLETKCQGPPGENEKALQLTIGAHTTIGPNSQIHALSIGSCVRIGRNVTIHARSKIFDCCVIEDGSVIPSDMIVPPFSRVAGNPARIVGSLPECCGGEFVDKCLFDYGVFVESLAGKNL